MRIINLTPHPIAFANADGVVQATYAPDPSGPARVSQLPATLLPSWWTAHLDCHDGSDIPGTVPVYQSGGWADIECLPQQAEPGDTFVVSLFCAQAAKAEAAATKRALNTGTWYDGSPVLEEERPALFRRLDVLHRCVCPGTGPADHPIRNEAGQVVAVTRLVRV